MTWNARNAKKNTLHPRIDMNPPVHIRRRRRRRQLTVIVVAIKANLTRRC